MKVISFILLICFISSRFLKLPEIKRPLEKFVSMADVSSSQNYDETKVKLIETSFDMTYSSSLHFKYSNSPVAPRTDGGYYIAFADTYKYLHVLSYDKTDKL